MRRLPAAVAAALVLLAGPVAVARPAGAAVTGGAGVDVLAVEATSETEVSLVAAVQPAPATPLTASAVHAAADGAELPTRMRPVLSDAAAVGLVLDASDDGAGAARDGVLSGAASFLLQLPAGARTAVLADRAPPEVIAPTSVGVSDDLRATTDLRGRGGRATSDALTLAVRELPDWPAVQPVVVLATGASDAGGEPASALAERLRRERVVLVVVGTGPESGFWRRVAAATGGLAIAARPDQAIGAFDAAAEALRARYAVAFDRPPDTARVDLLVDAGERRTTTTIALPPPGAAPRTDPGDRRWPWAVGGGLLVIAVAAAVTAVVRRRPRRPDPASGGPAEAPEAATPALFAPTGPQAASPPAAGSPTAGSPAAGSPPGGSPSPTLLPRSVDARLVPPEDRVLDHRVRAWTACMPDVAPELLRWTAAVATLAGADTPDEAQALLSRLPALRGAGAQVLRDRLIRWWAEAAPGPRLLNPLGPDRLAEHLVSSTMASVTSPGASAGMSAGDLFDDLLRSGSDRQVATMLEHLARAHAGQPFLAQLTDEAVARQFVALAHRLTDEDDPHEPAAGPLDAVLRDGLLRLLTPPVVQRLLPDDDDPSDHASPDDVWRDRTIGDRATARVCRELAGRAGDSGDDDVARALSHVAARIDAALATSTAAEDGYRQKLRRHEQLVVREPGNSAHWRALAAVQTRLADLDRAERRLALADAGYRRAIESLTALVGLDPDEPRHRQELAGAHRRLADLDAEAGWTEQAQAGYRRARELEVPEAQGTEP